jgi:hypothetical protein
LVPLLVTLSTPCWALNPLAWASRFSFHCVITAPSSSQSSLPSPSSSCPYQVGHNSSCSWYVARGRGPRSPLTYKAGRRISLRFHLWRRALACLWPAGGVTVFAKFTANIAHPGVCRSTSPPPTSHGKADDPIKELVLQQLGGGEIALAASNANVDVWGSQWRGTAQFDRMGTVRQMDGQ